MPPPRNEEKARCRDKKNQTKEGKGARAKHPRGMKNESGTNQHTQEHLRVMSERRGREAEQKGTGPSRKEKRSGRQGNEVQPRKHNNSEGQDFYHRHLLNFRLMRSFGAILEPRSSENNIVRVVTPAISANWLGDHPSSVATSLLS
jgi:hypothetical protein